MVHVCFKYSELFHLIVLWTWNIVKFYLLRQMMGRRCMNNWKFVCSNVQSSPKVSLPPSRIYVKIQWTDVCAILYLVYWQNFTVYLLSLSLGFCCVRILVIEMQLVSETFGDFEPPNTAVCPRRFYWILSLWRLHDIQNVNYFILLHGNMLLILLFLAYVSLFSVTDVKLYMLRDILFGSVFCSYVYKESYK